MTDALISPNELFNIKGKVAIVTGASGAFGKVAAKVLAASGCKLVLAAGNETALKEISEECRSLGSEITAINRRPETEEDCEFLMQEALNHYHSVDILVVASGFNKVAKIDEMALETFQEIMEANTTQSWMLAKAATKHMKAQGRGGKIIFLSSARGLLGHPAGYTAYCASKSAVDGITKALGCELGTTGITVNAIAPTVFRSPLTAWMFKDTDEAQTVRGNFLTRLPKGRLGEPEDLAGPLLFLASRASDFYTGHILYADGGYTAG